MKTYALRLHPNQDLLLELENFVRRHQLTAACLLTCAGSLQKAVLRLANQKEATELNGPFEIVSLTGTLSVNGSHCHICLADGQGHTVGAHLLEGCRIYTTAELVLGQLPGTTFYREVDSATGYDELYIETDHACQGE